MPATCTEPVTPRRGAGPSGWFPTRPTRHSRELSPSTSAPHWPPPESFLSTTTAGRPFHTTTGSTPLRKGRPAAGKLLEHNYGWASFSHNYWLDTVAFGMEYGPQDADPYGDGPASFSLDISSYCLALRTTVGKAT